MLVESYLRKRDVIIQLNTRSDHKVRRLATHCFAIIRPQLKDLLVFGGKLNDLPKCSSLQNQKGAHALEIFYV